MIKSNVKTLLIFELKETMTSALTILFSTVLVLF